MSTAKVLGLQVLGHLQVGTLRRLTLPFHSYRTFHSIRAIHFCGVGLFGNGVGGER